MLLVLVALLVAWQCNDAEPLSCVLLFPLM